MSLYGVMRTSASGMNAQADRLGAVSDNIANASTVGYKRASIEFSTLVLESGVTAYESGSVEPHIRNSISEQGAFSYTTSVTDLAVRGEGFFVVNDSSGQTFLTRAGSFVMDGEGVLKNAGGLTLLGYELAPGAPTPVANGAGGLKPVNIATLSMQAEASSAGKLYVNFPSNSSLIAPGSLPSDNISGSTYTTKTSLTAFDNLGNEVILDVYSAMTAAGTWELSVYDQATATSGGFPYGSGPISMTALTFDPANGQLSTTSPTSIDIAVPNGATLTLDLSKSSQLAAPYTVIEATVNGNSPSPVDRIEISDDGYLYSIYENGARAATYRIPLASVASADNMLPLMGNVYQVTQDSGDMMIGFPGEDGLGTMVSGALEKSTVDLATELTTLIEAEKNYTANSKVFQTGADLMDVLVNLKR